MYIVEKEIEVVSLLYYFGFGGGHRAGLGRSQMLDFNYMYTDISNPGHLAPRQLVLWLDNSDPQYTGTDISAPSKIQLGPISLNHKVMILSINEYVYIL